MPLNLLVLKMYLFLRKENAGQDGQTLSTWVKFQIILKELKLVWGRANIPMREGPMR